MSKANIVYRLVGGDELSNKRSALVNKHKIYKVDRLDNNESSYIDSLKEKSKGEIPKSRLTISEAISKSTLDNSSNVESFLTNLGLDLSSDTLETRDGNGDTPLLVAVKQQKYDVAKDLLQMGSDPNVQNSDGNTIYHFVVSYNDLDALKSLIVNLTNINLKNNDGLIPLHLAIQQDFLNVAVELLDIGADPNIKDNQGRNSGHLLLHNLNRFFQTGGGDADDLLGKMLEKGLDVNSVDNEGKTILFKAVEFYSDNSSSSMAMINKILNNKGNPNIKDNTGQTVGHYIVENFADFDQNLDLFSALIDGGLDVDSKDNEGRTLLYIVLEKKRYNYIDKLMEKDVDPNIQTNGRYPLNVVIDDNCSNSGLLNNFISYERVDLNLFDGNGETFLTKYIKECPRWVKSLLEKGTNPNTANKAGKTPLEIAFEENNKKTVNILIENGAHKPNPDVVPVNLREDVEKQYREFDIKNTEEEIDTNTLNSVFKNVYERKTGLTIQKLLEVLHIDTLDTVGVKKTVIDAYRKREYDFSKVAEYYGGRFSKTEEWYQHINNVVNVDRFILKVMENKLDFQSVILDGYTFMVLCDDLPKEFNKKTIFLTEYPEGSLKQLVAQQLDSPSYITHFIDKEQVESNINIDFLTRCSKTNKLRDNLLLARSLINKFALAHRFRSREELGRVPKVELTRFRNILQDIENNFNQTDVNNKKEYWGPYKFYVLAIQTVINQVSVYGLLGNKDVDTTRKDNVKIVLLDNNLSLFYLDTSLEYNDRYDRLRVIKMVTGNLTNNEIDLSNNWRINRVHKIGWSALLNNENSDYKDLDFVKAKDDLLDGFNPVMAKYWFRRHNFILGYTKKVAEYRDNYGRNVLHVKLYMGILPIEDDDISDNTVEAVDYHGFTPVTLALFTMNIRALTILWTQFNFNIPAKFDYNRPDGTYVHYATNKYGERIQTNPGELIKELMMFTKEHIFLDKYMENNTDYLDLWDAISSINLTPVKTLKWQIYHDDKLGGIDLSPDNYQQLVTSAGLLTDVHTLQIKQDKDSVYTQNKLPELGSFVITVSPKNQSDAPRVWKKLILEIVRYRSRLVRLDEVLSFTYRKKGNQFQIRSNNKVLSFFTLSPPYLVRQIFGSNPRVSEQKKNKSINQIKQIFYEKLNTWRLKVTNSSKDIVLAETTIDNIVDLTLKQNQIVEIYKNVLEDKYYHKLKLGNDVKRALNTVIKLLLFIAKSAMLVNINKIVLKKEGTPYFISIYIPTDDPLNTVFTEQQFIKVFGKKQQYKITTKPQPTPPGPTTKTTTPVSTPTVSAPTALPVSPASTTTPVKLPPSLPSEKEVNDFEETNKDSVTDTTYLHIAAQKGNLEMVKHYIENIKMDVDVGDKYKSTPLHYAAEGEKIEVVKYLLKKGANKNAVSEDGDRPVDLARIGTVKDLLEGKKKVLDKIEEEKVVTKPVGRKPLFKMPDINDRIHRLYNALKELNDGFKYDEGTKIGCKNINDIDHDKKIIINTNLRTLKTVLRGIGMDNDKKVKLIDFLTEDSKSDIYKDLVEKLEKLTGEPSSITVEVCQDLINPDGLFKKFSKKYESRIQKVEARRAAETKKYEESEAERRAKEKEREEKEEKEEMEKYKFEEGWQYYDKRAGWIDIKDKNVLLKGLKESLRFKKKNCVSTYVYDIIIPFENIIKVTKKTGDYISYEKRNIFKEVSAFLFERTKNNNENICSIKLNITKVEKLESGKLKQTSLRYYDVKFTLETSNPNIKILEKQTLKELFGEKLMVNFQLKYNGISLIFNDAKVGSSTSIFSEYTNKTTVAVLNKDYIPSKIQKHSNEIADYNQQLIGQMGYKEKREYRLGRDVLYDKSYVNVTPNWYVILHKLSVKSRKSSDNSYVAKVGATDVKDIPDCIKALIDVVKKERIESIRFNFTNLFGRDNSKNSEMCKSLMETMLQHIKKDDGIDVEFPYGYKTNINFANQYLAIYDSTQDYQNITPSTPRFYPPVNRRPTNVNPLRGGAYTKYKKYKVKYYKLLQQKQMLDKVGNDPTINISRLIQYNGTVKNLSKDDPVRMIQKLLF